MSSPPSTSTDSTYADILAKYVVKKKEATTTIEVAPEPRPKLNKRQLKNQRNKRKREQERAYGHKVPTEIGVTDDSTHYVGTTTIKYLKRKQRGNETRSKKLFDCGIKWAKRSAKGAAEAAETMRSECSSTTESFERRSDNNYRATSRACLDLADKRLATALRYKEAAELWEKDQRNAELKGPTTDDMNNLKHKLFFK